MAYLLKLLIFSCVARATVGTTTARTTLPPLVPAVHSVKLHNGDNFVLPRVLRVLVDEAFANSTLDDGLTLIPPTLNSFAEIFASDVKELFPHTSPQLSVVPASHTRSSTGYVFLTLSPHLNLTLASGSPTTEGYELNATSAGITIAGTGAKGAFWGTRTLLQGLVQGLGHFPSSMIRDQPDWPTRGIMLGAFPADVRVAVIQRLRTLEQMWDVTGTR